VNAAPGPSESTIVSVTPERILDTRDPNDVGLAGPFTSPVSQKLQVTGAITTATGTKTVVPTGATGVLLNVTAVAPTADGFISIRPGDAAGAPTTSSLNVTRGAILPNAVQVALPTAGVNAGRIDITFDAYGVAGQRTEILIDVVGYTTNTGLQQLVASAPIARSVHTGNVSPNPNGLSSVALSVPIDVPVAGLLHITGSALAFTSGADIAICRITSGIGNASATGPFAASTRAVPIPASSFGSCATNLGVPVAAGSHVINLALFAQSPTDFTSASLDVLFIAGGMSTATLVGEAEVIGGS
jgi:hypothetical protein